MNLKRSSENLETNKSEIYCPQCGARNDLDSQNVKFCRFCGLSLLESRDAVRGLTEIKQKGLGYANWGYWILQALFIMMIMLLIPTFPWWASAIFMLIFALSNGFFIAGQIAAAQPDRYSRRRELKNANEKQSEPVKDKTFSAITSITENTTRNLSRAAVSDKNRTTKLI